MTTLDNILELLKINEMENKQFAEKLGITESTIEEWISGENKSYLDYLDAISDLFVIPIDCIKQEVESQNSNVESNSFFLYCPICGLNYCQIEEDIETHKKVHEEYLKAVELFGFNWHYSKREKVKFHCWKVIYDNEVTNEKKQIAILNIVRCYFSRSVEGYSFELNKHPKFNDYFAMMLHADSLKGVKENLTHDKYNELIEKYGLKEGIKSGYSYYMGSSNNSNK
ncbi:MAG: helix-turn-helix transcriptional regulator [Clostridia bacterium]